MTDEVKFAIGAFLAVVFAMGLMLLMQECDNRAYDRYIQKYQQDAARSTRP